MTDTSAHCDLQDHGQNSENKQRIINKFYIAKFKMKFNKL